eukprot:UN09968
MNYQRFGNIMLFYYDLTAYNGIIPCYNNNNNTDDNDNNDDNNNSSSSYMYLPLPPINNTFYVII